MLQAAGQSVLGLAVFMTVASAVSNWIFIIAYPVYIVHEALRAVNTDTRELIESIMTTFKCERPFGFMHNAIKASSDLRYTPVVHV